MNASRGRVSIVGAGPGDPGLLTLRGRELLVSADAVVHDRLVSPEIVALARDATRYDVGKLPGRAREQQAAIDSLLVDLAYEGKRVVRLKGGDPFVFGRSGSELDALVAAGIQFEIVPGVTAAIAAPAYAGVPVTDRRYGGAVVIVTATTAINAATVKREDCGAGGRRVTADRLDTKSAAPPPDGRNSNTSQHSGGSGGRQYILSGRRATKPPRS